VIETFQDFARRVERARDGGRDFDADFFELTGHRVNRARWKLWGAESRRWQALPRVSFEVDDVLSTLFYRAVLPGWVYAVDATNPTSGIDVVLYGPPGVARATAKTLPLAFLAAAARAVDLLLCAAEGKAAVIVAHP
jgi:hypothetical protein